MMPVIDKHKMLARVEIVIVINLMELSLGFVIENIYLGLIFFGHVI